jgi:palmitoyl-protein thioesterase
MRALLVTAVACRPLDEWIELARTAPEDVLTSVSGGEGRVLAPLLPESAAAVDELDGSATPVVTAHGMGDSCFNPVSMARVTREIGAHLKTYAKCIPTGSGLASDSASGYFSGVEEAVDRFAEGIRKDPKLAGGFDAVGFSQGNTLIRGYIHRYNSPPVRRWLSVHGTVSGVVNVPGCELSSKSSLCQTLTHALLAPAAYTSTIQHHIFQAGYLRDPKRLSSSAYKKNSVIAQWNNEGDKVNATYKDNFVKVEKFIMVKALQDTMVEPKEGEHWEFVDSTGAVVPMKDSVLYKEDRFGLQSVDKAGKLVLETTAGDHLQFSQAELFGWLDKYFVRTAKSLVV